MLGARSQAVAREIERLFRGGTLSGLSDRELLERFVAKRDEAAFEALLVRHARMVLGVCRNALANADEVEDAFQATFLVLVRKARSLDGRGSLACWLHRVSRRIALQANASAARRRARERIAGASRAMELYPESEREARSLINDEVARLPAKLRGPVVLCYLEGLTYSAAAAQLGVSETAVRGRLARARRRLRDGLVCPGFASATLGTLSASAEAAQPASLLARTLELVRSLKPGECLALKAVSTQATVFAHRALRSMFMEKLKLCAAALFALGIVAGGAGAFARQMPRSEAESVDDRSSDTLVRPALAQLDQEPAQAKPEDGVDPELAKRALGRIVRTTPISQDCMVLAYMPDWNFGNLDNIGIGNNGGGVRTLLNWPTIKAEDTVAANRRFYVALYARKTNAGAAAGPIGIFPILEPWRERSSWKSLPDYDPTPAAQTAFEPGEGWKLFDITSLVRNQAKAGTKSNGMVLRFITEDRPNENGKLSSYEFVSREGTGEWAARRPVLLVVDAPNGATH
jgi:RNA polymerase sigma factor (sigma-70 family)